MIVQFGFAGKDNQYITGDDGDGTILFQQGSGGIAITVVNVEHGSVLGADGTALYQW